MQLQRQFPMLDLKSTAWLAGFPITNAEVVFSKNVVLSAIRDDDDAVYANLYLLHEYHKRPEDKNLTKDFIGPSVDTGFRLCALSNPRKFVISVDLALMLVHAIRGRPAGAEEFDVVLHYDGRVPLKGVLKGKDYPVFWIDMAVDSGLEKLEDKLLEFKPRNTDDIKSFCEEFFESHSSSIMMPYIVGNPDAYFSKLPPAHAGKMEKMREYWTGENQRRKDEGDASKSAGTGHEIQPLELEGLTALIRKRLDDTKERDDI